MKIRQGFVSNSSSSSFCIYGKRIEDFEDLEKLYKEITNKELKIKDDSNGCGVEVYNVIEELAEKNGVESYTTEDLFPAYFGISWKDIKDDETGKQFKQRVEKILRKDCTTHSGEYSC